MARDEEDAPWLAEAAPATATAPRLSGFWKLVIALAGVALVALTLVLVLGRRDPGSTAGYMEAAQAPLIEADPGPYKVVPADPRGLVVPGEGEMIYEAGQGAAPTSVIDPNSVPEEPIGRPRDLLPQTGAVPAPAATMPPAAEMAPPLAAPAAAVPVAPPRAVPPPPAPAPKPVPPKPVPPKPAPSKPVPPEPRPAPPPPRPVARAQAGTVQLGAFSSRQKAEAEWARLASGAGLSRRSIEETTRDGQTLYRLRGTATDIAAACAAVQALRGACAPVK